MVSNDLASRVATGEDREAPKGVVISEVEELASAVDAKSVRS